MNGLHPEANIHGCQKNSVLSKRFVIQVVCGWRLPRSKTTGLFCPSRQCKNLGQVSPPMQTRCCIQDGAVQVTILARANQGFQLTLPVNEKRTEPTFSIPKKQGQKAISDRALQGHTLFGRAAFESCWCFRGHRFLTLCNWISSLTSSGLVSF